MARAADPCELTASIVVERSVQQCWDLYINNALVPDWAPAVTRTDSDELTLAHGVIRKNHVVVDGKSGHTVEQCTMLDPLKRIEFTVLEETFGFSHMLTSYGFGLSFDVQGLHTLIVMQTRYVPKKIFASLMNSKATQQQLLYVMSEQLDGFKTYAQSQ